MCTQDALNVAQIKSLTAEQVHYHFLRVHKLFKVNLNAPDTQALADPKIYSLFKGGSRPWERYVIYQSHTTLFRYASGSREHYVRCFDLFAAHCDIKNEDYLVYPLEDVCAAVAAIVENRGLERPWQLLNHFRVALGMLTMTQIGIPDDSRVKSLADYEGSSVFNNLQLSLAQQERQKILEPSSTPVAHRAEKQTLTEEEHLLLLQKVLCCTHRDLLIPLRASTGLALLLACGGRSQALKYMGFNGFTVSSISTSHAVGHSLKMFKIVSIGVHKTHQGGRRDETGLIRSKDPLLCPVNQLALHDLCWNHGVDKVAGLSIPDLIGLRDPRWLDIKLLAEAATPTVVASGKVGEALRYYITKFEKEVSTRLGRNSLVGRLLKEGISEFQIATLMKWSVNHTMQSTYATRDPASVLPALFCGAGFPPGAGIEYSIPRGSVEVETVAPNVFKAFFSPAALLSSLEREKIELAAAIQAAKEKGVRDMLWKEYEVLDAAFQYLDASLQLTAVLLQDLVFSIRSYGSTFLLFRLGVIQEMAASSALMQESSALFRSVVLAHHAADSLESLSAELQSCRGVANFPTQGPHFDLRCETAGKAFVQHAQAAYVAALQELIASKQPLPETPPGAAGPSTVSLEANLLQQLLAAVQGLQNGVPMVALPASQALPAPEPLPAPSQGQPLGSGVLLSSLRLTNSMTFEALQNYQQLTSGSQEKKRVGRQISKRRVMYRWINSSFLHQGGWELSAVFDFMELARRAVMASDRVMPLGVFVDTVGRSVVCTTGRSSLDKVIGSRADLYGTLQQFRDRFVAALGEYCQVHALHMPDVPLPRVADASSDEEMEGEAGDA